MTGGAIGEALRRAGLTSRLLAAWVGTSRIAALPAQLDRPRPAHGLVTADRVPPSIAPAAAALALFVAGEPVALDIARRAQLPIDALVGRGLCEIAEDRLVATVAIVPLGTSLLVCDRLDTVPSRELVAWPDDSSHHLAGAIPPGRRARWVDLGTGSAFAPLARPELGAAISGIDLNPRAVHHARLGAELSGIGHLTVTQGDLAAPVAPAELVTCNAPLPDALGRGLPELWRHADPAFFHRLWRAVPRLIAPGGLAVVHAAGIAIPDELPGERVIVTYAPEFAVLWWRPDAARQLVVAHRTLTPERPHLDAADRDAALGTR